LRARPAGERDTNRSALSADSAASAWYVPSSVFIDQPPPAKYQPLISQYAERTFIVNEDQFEAA
jgi:hypothetical protein